MGTTLVEVLVTVMVLGVAFVAILGGMGTTFASSALHREQARVETEVRRYAEALQAEPFSTSCPAAYAKASFTPPFVQGPGYDAVEPVIVGYLDATTGASTTCSSTALHVVRLTVLSTVDDRADASVDILKRPT
jgi:Tfp pilus assembly protein PilV